ncbi:hypothetical protein BLNAU_11264 [Blattamonas nauphoetae]|uniref:Coiled-coil protein n=1 Tax=Blattamonas nauphoetae TaxID=2049346 RepID=A0ABQ9XMT9_9EUKA|nr:hypothetical protein BLNAU_11264 [Blattamonas nauphoetae]
MSRGNYHTQWNTSTYSSAFSPHFSSQTPQSRNPPPHISEGLNSTLQTQREIILDLEDQLNDAHLHAEKLNRELRQSFENELQTMRKEYEFTISNLESELAARTENDLQMNSTLLQETISSQRGKEHRSRQSFELYENSIRCGIDVEAIISSEQKLSDDLRREQVENDQLKREVSKYRSECVRLQTQLAFLQKRTLSGLSPLSTTISLEQIPYSSTGASTLSSIESKTTFTQSQLSQIEKNELQTIQTEKQQTEQENIALRRDILTLQKEKKRHAEHISKSDIEIDHLTRQLDELILMNEHLQNHLHEEEQRHQEAIDELQRRISSQNDEQEQQIYRDTILLQRELERAKRDLHKCHDDNDKITQELTALQQSSQNISTPDELDASKHTSTQRELSNLQKENMEMRQENSRLMEENENLQKELKTATTIAETHKAQSPRENISSNDALVSQLKEDHDSYVKELTSKHQNELNELKRDFITKQDALREEMKKQEDESRRQMEQLRDTNNRLQTTLNILTEQEAKSHGKERGDATAESEFQLTERSTNESFLTVSEEHISAEDLYIIVKQARKLDVFVTDFVTWYENERQIAISQESSPIRVKHILIDPTTGEQRIFNGPPIEKLQKDSRKSTVVEHQTHDDEEALPPTIQLESVLNRIGERLSSLFEQARNVLTFLNHFDETNEVPTTASQPGLSPDPSLTPVENENRKLLVELNTLTRKLEDSKKHISQLEGELRLKKL